MEQNLRAFLKDKEIAEISIVDDMGTTMQEVNQEEKNGSLIPYSTDIIKEAAFAVATLKRTG
jgi:hypothetical protein